MNFLRLPFLGFCFALVSTILVSSCVAPALLMTSQSQIMWALLKPMVGLDPKEANLFKQPLIQSRLQPLLGEHYDAAVQLLETADRIQQEGPLFYVVSQYTPVPQFAEKAGFVWNSDTNQMAVMLVSGGAPQIFAEKLNDAVAAQVPAWPAELSEYTDPAKLRQQALDKAQTQIKEAVPVPAAIAPLTDKMQQMQDLKGQTQTLIKQKQQAVTEQVLAPITTTQQTINSQVQQTQTAVAAQVLSPITTAQQSINTQVQQTQTAVTEQVLSPITTAQQKIDTQVQQTQTAVTEQALSPITTAQQKIDTRVQQAQSAVAEQVLTPITPIQQAVNTQGQQTEQTVIEQFNAQTSSDQSALKNNSQLPAAPLPTVSNSSEAVQMGDMPIETNTDDDLAAELADEQRTVSHARQTQIQALQSEITATSQQLQQSHSEAETLKLQNQLLHLRAQLQQLQSQE